MTRARVGVAYRGEAQAARARQLADRLELPLGPLEADFLLVRTGERLELREVGGGAGPVFVDFARAPRRERRDPLLRAVGLKGSELPGVVDATAGLGQDAFALARQGAQVTLLERSPVVAALLEDGLDRAGRTPELAATAARMRLVTGDALELLPQLPPPAVVYLDPMYPLSEKRALKRKEMRLFRGLVGDDEDVEQLFAQAREVALERVVVKRPRKAPFLGGSKPSATWRSTTVRFDLYLPAP